MADVIIPGTIIAFAGNTIPAGWDLCDGKEVSRNNPMYAALHRVIGNIWGGDGSPNFRLPDLRGQFLMGAVSAAGIGAGGGSQNHNHGGQTSGLVNADGYHVSPDNRNVAPQATGYLHGHAISEVSNLPPYKTIFYLIKL